MSKLLSVNPRLTPYTTCPGTLVYMPPEALRDPPVYSKKIDSFSFGVIEVQILTRQFPDPGPASEMVEDRRYRVGRIQVPIPDSERRKSHINLIDPAHPLLPMALRCINYSEEDRPSAEVLCREIALLREAPRYTQSLEQAQQRGGAAQGSERRLREENAQLSQQNRELRTQLETTTQELQQNAADSRRETEQLTQENQQLRQELLTKDGTLEARQRENQQLQRTVQDKDRQLQANEQLTAEFQLNLIQHEETNAADSRRDNQQLTQENQQLRRELLTKDGTLEAREREIQQLQRTVQDKDRQLRANEQVTAEFQQNLLQREQMIRGLEETISQLGQGPEEPVKGKQYVPEAKQMPLQQPKQQPQATARTAKSQKHPKQEPTLPTPPRGILGSIASYFSRGGVQGGVTAADGESAYKCVVKTSPKFRETV